MDRSNDRGGLEALHAVREAGARIGRTALLERDVAAVEPARGRR